MRAKQFFYASAAVLMLMLAVLIGFHLGQSKALAQGIGDFTGIAFDGTAHVWVAITSSGDVYCTTGDLRYNKATGRYIDEGGPDTQRAGWQLVSNVMGRGPVPAEKGTLGPDKKMSR